MTMRRKVLYTLLGIPFAIAVFSPAAVAAVPCESLLSLSVPNTTITSAKTVAKGAFVPPGGPGNQAAAFKDLPAFCRLTATLKPSSDSDIKMEVWMPVTGWNGNFQPRGTAGMGGSIPLAAMGGELKEGYATAGSDTGHVGDSRYVLDHPEKVTDFEYRSAHELNVRGKAIIAAYYGEGAKLSFIDGCGGGAFMAQNAMQRYPADYNGITITGFSHKTRHAIWQQWVWDATHKDAASNLPKEKLEILHNAALNACDALDGVKNGEIENPTVCKFDPKVTECRPGAATASCLTPPQVEAARKIYAGPTNPRTGQAIYYPPMPGSELAWAAMAGPEPFGLSVDFLKYFVFKDGNWDPKAHVFNYDSHVALAENPLALRANANNPDIGEFVKRGGKLLLYEGWSDHFTLPGIAIDYYKRVVEKIGPAAAKDSVRLFMVPAMTHCEDRGEFDMVGELENWIKTKKAPDQIIGRRVWELNKVAGTRLLCPYPQVATYKGSGNTDAAANYTCKAQ